MEEETTKEKKRYWLKLDKDFLKSSQMKIIRNMPNGKDYIIFYLSLMLESVETVGHLRFTSLVPYNAEMLSAITDTNVDIVRSAIKIFCELGLMQIFDDGTIFIPEVPKITGKESESAERVRKFRAKQKQELLQCNDNVTKSNDNKEKDKEQNINKEIKNKYGKFERVKLTNKEYDNLCLEFGKEFINNQINLLDEYLETNNNKNKYTNFNLVLRKSIRENWFNKSTQNEPYWLNQEIKEENVVRTKEEQELYDEIIRGY